MKLGASPLSAQLLWVIKADQQSMSWHVFSSLWNFSSSDATIQLRLLFSPQLAFRRLAVVHHSAQKCNLPLRVHPASGYPECLLQMSSLSLFFFLDPLPILHQVNIGLLMASGFCSPWSLLALFSPLLRFSPAVKLTLWVSWQDKCFVNSRPTSEFHATTFRKSPLAMRQSATWRYINYTHGHLERVLTGWRSSDCTNPHKDGCYLKPASYLAH